MPIRFNQLITLGFCLGNYRYDATVTVSTLESNYTVNQSEESVILTHTYILAWIMNCTTLTNDDVTGSALLTAPNLNA